MKKYLVILLAILIVTTVAFAGKTKLTLWTMRTVSSQIDNLKRDIEEFEKLNPNIEVSIEAVSYDTVYQRLLTAGLVSELPDVFNCIEAMVAFMQARNYLVPMDDVVDTLGKENFFPRYLKWMKLNDHYWAVPDWALHQAIYYRKSLFEEKGLEIPKDWNQLLKVAEEMNQDTDNDGDIDSYGLGIPLGKHMVAQQTLGAIMYSNNVSIFNSETGEYEFGDKKEEFIESLDYLVKLYKAVSPQASINWSWADYRNAFVKGVTNMTVGWGAEVLIAMSDNPELLDDIGVFPFPSGPREDSYPPKHNFGGAYFFTVSNNGDERVAASKKLVEFLYEPRRVANRAYTRPIFAMPAYLPAMPYYYEMPIVKQFSGLVRKIEMQIMPYEERHGLEAGLNPVAGEIESSDIFGEAIHHVIIDNWSYEDAFNWLDKQLKELISQIPD